MPRKEARRNLKIDRCSAVATASMSSPGSWNQARRLSVGADMKERWRPLIEYQGIMTEAAGVVPV